MTDISRKLVLTYVVFITGCVVTFMTDAPLGDFTIFAAVVLGAYGTANVAEKRLTGVGNGRQRD